MRGPLEVGHLWLWLRPRQGCQAEYGKKLGSAHSSCDNHRRPPRPVVIRNREFEAEPAGLLKQSGFYTRRQFRECEFQHMVGNAPDSGEISSLPNLFRFLSISLWAYTRAPVDAFGQLGTLYAGRCQMRICDLIKDQDTYQAELGHTVLETVRDHGRAQHRRRARHA